MSRASFEGIGQGLAHVFSFLTPRERAVAGLVTPYLQEVVMTCALKDALFRFWVILHWCASPRGVTDDKIEVLIDAAMSGTIGGGRGVVTVSLGDARKSGLYHADMFLGRYTLKTLWTAVMRQLVIGRRDKLVDNMISRAYIWNAPYNPSEFFLLAARWGNTQILGHVFDSGTFISRDVVESALFTAAVHGTPESVMAVRRIPVTKRFQEHDEVFERIARQWSPRQMAIMLRSGALTFFDMSQWFIPITISAATGGYTDIITRIISSRNTPRYGAATRAVIAAAKGGYTDIVELLWRAPNCPIDIDSATDAAVESGIKRMVEILVEVFGERFPISRALCAAAEKGEQDIVMFLLEQGQAKGVLPALFLPVGIRVTPRHNKNLLVAVLAFFRRNLSDAVIRDAVQGHLVPCAVIMNSVECLRELLEIPGIVPSFRPHGTGAFSAPPKPIEDFVRLITSDWSDDFRVLRFLISLPGFDPTAEDNALLHAIERAGPLRSIPRDILQHLRDDPRTPDAFRTPWFGIAHRDGIPLLNFPGNFFIA